MAKDYRTPEAPADQGAVTPQDNPPSEEQKFSVASAPPTWHAYQTGHATMRVKRVNFQGPVTGRPELKFDWKHQAASQLHGWAAHEMATGGQEVRISRADYEAAIVAVSAEKIAAPPPPAPPARTPHGRNRIPGAPIYRPHAAAMSQYAPKLETRKA